MAYLDDVTIFSDSATAANVAFKLFSEMGSDIGLFLAPTKTVSWSPIGMDSTHLACLRPSFNVTDNTGISLLGGSVTLDDDYASSIAKSSEDWEHFYDAAAAPRS